MRFQAPRGTRDFYPEELAVRRHIESVWRQASIDFGFEEVDGPTFEHLDLYTVKSGEGIVNELFSFKRAGGEDTYALRPEFTPTLARLIAAKGSALPPPIKWFAIPNFFRAERPQRGRLREFFQWNVDLVGLEGAALDAEVIATAVTALRRFGLTPQDVQVRLSHRLAAAGIVRRLGVPEERVAAAFELLDRRDKLEPAEFAKRATELGLDDAARARFDAIARTTIPLGGELAAPLEALGIALDDVPSLFSLRDELAAVGLAEWCRIDLGIVRGLAYYTGTVFEIHEATGAERAVAGGGRYDGLVELFGGPRMPAMGFGMGDVVLGLLLKERGLLPGDAATLLPRPDVFVISAGGDEAERAMRRLTAELRAAGLHARHTYKTTRNVGKLLSDANRNRSRTALILGDELAEGRAMLKDLKSGDQQPIAISSMIEELRRLLGR